MSILNMKARERVVVIPKKRRTKGRTTGYRMNLAKFCMIVCMISNPFLGSKEPLRLAQYARSNRLAWEGEEKDINEGKKDKDI